MHGGTELSSNSPQFAIDPILLRSILDAANAAPSGDNCQPFAFRVTLSGFEVLWNAVRAESMVDFNHAGSRLALGALLENVRLAASAGGLAASFTLDPDPERPELWARVTLKASAAASDTLNQWIFERRTTRTRFAPMPISKNQSEGLLSASLPPAQLRVITDRDILKSIGLILAGADEVRFRIPEANTDLHRWLRWTPEEAKRTRDGLDLDTLALGAVERSFLRLTGNSTLNRLSVALGASKVAARLTVDLIRNSGAVGCVSVPGLSNGLIVDAGRSFERVWLSATSLGLCLQPMATLPLLGMAPVEVGPLKRGDRRRLEALGRLFRTTVGLAAEEHAVMVFRVGVGDPCAVRSLRRPLDSLTS